MEKFPNNVDSQESETHAASEAVSRNMRREARTLESSSLLGKIGDKSWVRRFGLVLGLMAGGSAENAFAQTKQEQPAEMGKSVEAQLEDSVKSTKGNLDFLRDYLKTEYTSEGMVRHGDFPEAKQQGRVFEQDMEGQPDRDIKVLRSIQTNDHFTVIVSRVEAQGKLEHLNYFFDFGNDGSIDRVVHVKSDKEGIPGIFSTDLKNARTVEQAAAEAAVSGDKSNARDVVLIDTQKKTASLIDFETGSVSRKNDMAGDVNNWQHRWEFEVGAVRASAEAKKEH